MHETIAKIVFSADPVLSRAYVTARTLHIDQKRKFDGEPYIEHPVRVANLVRRTGAHRNVVAAALLHDTIEDCGVTADQLRDDWCQPQEVVDLVVVLTKLETETRAEYILRVVKEPDCWVIKRADLLDNMSTLPPGHGMMEGYIKDLLVLHANHPRFMVLA